MKAVVFAYHNMGCTGISALLRNGIGIAAVFTHLDDPGENLWFDSVAELATTHDIPVFAPETVNHPIWVSKIRGFDPDVIFSFYYRHLLSSDILEIPPAGCLNLHGSLLPRYRGRCPINWVLVNGETETGVTLHHMTPKADDGDIVCQEKIRISDQDTAKTLLCKATETAAKMLDGVLPQIKAGQAPRSPQDPSQSSYHGGRRPQDGEIDWNHSATEIRNLVRAVTSPYPGAFSYVDNRKCFFWEVTEIPQEGQQVATGSVLSTTPLVIACNGAAVRMDYGQTENNVCTDGVQVGRELRLTEHMKFGPYENR
jgi:UDP-4-amino-4-deoxy-L-arabinose formyltransferase/UDP-glucuronic acid dehydrogenase (UDP-4-keto-hexauronic acid decarboxylating)